MRRVAQQLHHARQAGQAARHQPGRIQGACKPQRLHCLRQRLVSPPELAPGSGQDVAQLDTDPMQLERVGLRQGCVGA